MGTRAQGDPLPMSEEVPEADYDPTSETLKPPGDCTEAEHAVGQYIVFWGCKTGFVGKCRKDDGCESFKAMFEGNSSCCEARRNHNNTCFRGGNKTHREEAKDACKFAERCRKLYNFKCACDDRII
jgi:Novel toxin 16